MHVEVRDRGVVYEHREAVLVDAGLGSVLHDLVELGIAVVLPLFAVIAAERMRLARIWVEGLPLGAYVGVAVVVGDL
jgi:hypothetical protein